MVTGCGGFLGSEIVRQLLDRGDQVTGISRQEYPDLVSRGMHHCRGDLRDPEFVSCSIRECEMQKVVSRVSSLVIFRFGESEY